MFEGLGEDCLYAGGFLNQSVKLGKEGVFAIRAQIEAIAVFASADQAEALKASDLFLDRSVSQAGLSKDFTEKEFRSGTVKKQAQNLSSSFGAHDFREDVHTYYYRIGSYYIVIQIKRLK
jgi:hypothetical protein